MLRTALIAIYKAFVRPGLDSGDILYDQAFNLSFHQKLESTQYSANLAITRAIHSFSRKQDLLRAKLRISSITTVVRKLAMFYKIYKNSPLYLLKIIPEKTFDENMLQKILMVFRISILNFTFSKKLSFHLHSSNGTS